MAEQLSLLGRGEEGGVVGFAGLRHIALDANSWIDYVPGFVSGHQELYQSLREGVSFRRDRRMMYEREVDVPRCYATLPADGEVPQLLAQAGHAIGRHYRVPGSFERIGVALYEGGTDSVAFHRDHMPRDRPTLVAIISLGTPRRLLVRRHGGGVASRAFQLGWGDLFVMGGMSQADWEHGIPKVKHAHPRMSCVFRHVYDE